MPPREPAVPIDVLREAVRARAGSSSLRHTAAEIGMHHASIREFLNGRVPYGKNLDKIAEWYRRETNEIEQLREEVKRLSAELARVRKKLEECDKRQGVSESVN